MSQYLQVVFYYYSMQRMQWWFICAGIAMLVASLPVYLLGMHLAAYRLWLCGSMLAFLAPCFAAPITFRTLISNPSLSLVPGFSLMSVAGLLTVIIMASFAIPLADLFYGKGHYSPLLAMQLFITGSLYAGLLQKLATSRRAMLLSTILPVFIVVFINLNIGWLTPLIKNPMVIAVLTTCITLLWLASFRLLASKHKFMPVYNLHELKNQRLWSGYSLDNSFLARASVNNFSDPGVSLLLGFPNSIRNRLLYIVNFIILMPLLFTGMLYIFELVGKSHKTIEIGKILLIFSLFMTVIASISNSEFVGRCRYLWIRHGNSRQDHWRLLERVIQQNLLMIYLCFGLVALISGEAPSVITQYSVYLVTGSLFYSYFALCARIHHWSVWLQVFCLAGLNAAGILALTLGKVEHSILIALALIGAGIFRWLAVRSFKTIDWFLIRPKQFNGS